MKVPVALAVLIGIFVIACSSAAPAAMESVVAPAMNTPIPTVAPTLDHTSQAKPVDTPTPASTSEANPVDTPVAKSTDVPTDSEYKTSIASRDNVTSAISGSVDSWPDIVSFTFNKSDRFLVDIEHIHGGFPVRGESLDYAHAAAHVNFDPTKYPEFSYDVNPADYPPIYAVSDGSIYEVEAYASHRNGELFKYDIKLTFAQRNGKPVLFHYSIEPMLDPGDSSYYEPFILVSPGQQVQKGDAIAYMYLTSDAKDSPLIHFHLESRSFSRKGGIVPAIFTEEIVQDFHSRWGLGKGESEQWRKNYLMDGDVKIPACMGYKISAEENPFGTGPLECLN